jgi:tRNA pseudouridine38-40 synthase
MNIALGIEYSGANYCGWQRQSHSPSVQQCLEKALSQIADHDVSVFCAGRTDTGVHATGQVVNFKTESERLLKAWYLGANTKLPEDISIRWAKKMPDTFHARHTAFARRYRYILQNTTYPTGILKGKVTWYKKSLDVQRMHESAQILLGENNFSSFQASSCQSPTAFRYMRHINISRWQEFVVVDIEANAFLHHMVRNIVGCLLEVGSGKREIKFVEEVLSKMDRTQAPMTAKPDGLYLVNVLYPEEFEVAKMPLGPLMLPDLL